MQHRAVRRAKARRQKNDYWKKMAPVVIFFAWFGLRVRRARIKKIADAFGSYIRDRLNEKSFAELILPVTVLSAPEAGQ